LINEGFPAQIGVTACFTQFDAESGIEKQDTLLSPRVKITVGKSAKTFQC
jgi:hypothetical protein